jgi:hypothetical protein
MIAPHSADVENRTLFLDFNGVSLAIELRQHELLRAEATEGQVARARIELASYVGKTWVLTSGRTRRVLSFVWCR